MFRRRLSILLAAAAAAAAGFGTFKAAQLQAQALQAAVVVVKAPVPEGQAIPAEALEARTLPRDAVPPDAVATPAEAAGRTAAVDLFPGQVLQKPMVSDRPTRRDLAPGEVAVEVPLEIGKGATLLQPGDRVNVVVVLKDSGAQAEAAQQLAVYGTVIRGARVVALRDSSGNDVRPRAQGGALAAVAGAAQVGQSALPAAAILAVGEPEADVLAWYLDHATVRLVLAPWQQP